MKPTTALFLSLTTLAAAADLPTCGEVKAAYRASGCCPLGDPTRLAEAASGFCDPPFHEIVAESLTVKRVANSELIQSWPLAGAKKTGDLFVWPAFHTPAWNDYSAVVDADALLVYDQASNAIRKVRISYADDARSLGITNAFTVADDAVYITCLLRDDLSTYDYTWGAFEAEPRLPVLKVSVADLAGDVAIATKIADLPAAPNPTADLFWVDDLSNRTAELVAQGFAVNEEAALQLQGQNLNAAARSPNFANLQPPEHFYVADVRRTLALAPFYAGLTLGHELYYWGVDFAGPNTPVYRVDPATGAVASVGPLPATIFQFAPTPNGGVIGSGYIAPSPLDGFHVYAFPNPSNFSDYTHVTSVSSMVYKPFYLDEDHILGTGGFVDYDTLRVVQLSSGEDIDNRYGEGLPKIEALDLLVGQPRIENKKTTWVYVEGNKIYKLFSQGYFASVDLDLPVAQNPRQWTQLGQAFGIAMQGTLVTDEQLAQTPFTRYDDATAAGVIAPLLFSATGATNAGYMGVVVAEGDELTYDMAQTFAGFGMTVSDLIAGGTFLPPP